MLLLSVSLPSWLLSEDLREESSGELNCFFFFFGCVDPAMVAPKPVHLTLFYRFSRHYWEQDQGHYCHLVQALSQALHRTHVQGPFSSFL